MKATVVHLLLLLLSAQIVGCAAKRPATDRLDADVVVDGGVAEAGPMDDAGRDASNPDAGPDFCPLTPGTTIDVSGVIGTQDWTCDNIYRLMGTVFVSEGTLTIHPGTQIWADEHARLVVTPSARLVAVGTEERPIYFTGFLRNEVANDWGGIILAGTAPVDGSTTPRAYGFAVPDLTFGGDDAAHDCGQLAYVSIGGSGDDGPLTGLDRDRANNALVLAGCGTSTLVEDLRVYQGDHGLSFLGGAPTVRRVWIHGMEEVGIQWGLGFAGNLQYAVVHHTTGNDGIGPTRDSAAAVRDAPRIANVTVLTEDVTDNDDGINLDHATAGVIINAIVRGFRQDSIDIANANVRPDTQGGRPEISHSLFYETGPGTPGARTYFTPEGGVGNPADDDGGFDESAYFMMPAFSNCFGADPGLRPAASLDYTPSVPVPSGCTPEDPATRFGAPFESADYLGAVDPAGTDWVAWMRSAP